MSLDFCNPSNITDKYDQGDNYFDIIERGLQGFISAIDLMITSEYDYELSNLRY